MDAGSVKKNLRMSECIEAMEDLYMNEGLGPLSQPARTILRIDPDSVILTMPSVSARLKRFAVKIVTEYGKNPSLYQLPVQGGITVLMNSQNSQVLANLDSPSITAIRTGAVSGLATKYLSRSDSHTVTSIGSGQQAGRMLEAVCAVRKIKKAFVYSRNPENSRKFAEDMTEELSIDVQSISQRGLALKNADVINVATNSSSPVLSWSEVPKAVHINSIGTLPDKREVDLETICNSKLYVDTREGVLKEAGDVMHAITSGRVSEDSIIGDLASLVGGQVNGRQSNDEVTLFKSVGSALQDLYAADFAFSKLTRAS